MLLVLLGEFCSLALTSQSEASFFAVVMLRCQRCVPFCHSSRESTPCNQESLALRDISSVASSPTLAGGFARKWAALQLVGGGMGVLCWKSDWAVCTSSTAAFGTGITL